MSDLISRQAILDRTVNRNSIWNKITDSKGNNLEDILNSIPSVENKGEWIPVSERLPEKKVKDYLACCEDGYVATIMYDNGRWLINGNNVIAWMPLPEPYKAEKPETCKGCLEPCIMYEPDMRACKKKVTERGEE